MSNIEEPNNVDLQFQWGKKRGVGGAKMDVQFYESFTFDELSYSLYDCVYLFKKGESEPYIGKIVKIWGQHDHKKVKILWFFRPNELQNYLGDHSPLEKEIFLASGEGVGLSNVNPLEAIAGKCSVICTSKDERNPQPSKDALETADYIFYRTFNVGTYAISDNIADKIAGIEVKFLLNQKGDQKPSSVSKSEANGFDENGKADANTPVSCNLSQLNSLKSLENRVKIDEPEHAPCSISKDEVIERKHSNDSKHLLDENSVPKLKTDPFKDVGEANKSVAGNVEENINPAKNKAHSDVCDDKPSKKMRLDDLVKPSDDSHENKNVTGARKVNIESDDEDSGKVSVQLHKESFEKMKPSENKAKPLDESLQKTSPAVLLKNNTKVEHQILEVTRRPDADRSKWFKGLPWEGRMQKADEQGTLVLLQNFDRSFTSTDIEDIIYHTFKQSCTAKVMPELPFHNPHYGQAYVIFKTRDAADLAVQKINRGCLMLPNGRAFTASKGMLKLPPKLPTLPGHLSVDKIKIQMQREEMRRAVSTSHCSQPNTIEYEMAMDWILVQEKSVSWFNWLFKGHGDEGKQVRKNLKTHR